MDDDLVSPPVLGVLIGLSVLIFAYSLVIAQQILLGFIAASFVFGVYLFYLFVKALWRLVESAETIAEAEARKREAEAQAVEREPGPRE